MSRYYSNEYLQYVKHWDTFLVNFSSRSLVIKINIGTNNCFEMYRVGPNKYLAKINLNIRDWDVVPHSIGSVYPDQGV